jgi:hypothetical protein
MHKALGWVVLVLLATPAFAQVPASDEITCPLDGYHFRVPAAEPGDRSGGMDSDGCPHDLKGETLAQTLVVCPRCNYAAGRLDFASPLQDEQKRRLLGALVRSTYRGVTDGVADIPGWERFRLAAKCAAALGNVKDETTDTKFAAWVVRAEATKPATVAYGSPLRLIAPLSRRLNEWMSTRGVEEVIREIEEKLAEAKKPEEQNRLRLHLAMMCERAGFAARRDEVVSGLERSMGSDAGVAAAVGLFKRLVALEADFQKKLVGLMGKAPGKVENRMDRAMESYLLADTLRRLGRNAEAVDAYRSARRLMSEPLELRSYTDHFLSILAPGEPLPTPEVEKPVEVNPSGPGAGKDQSSTGGDGGASGKK